MVKDRGNYPMTKLRYGNPLSTLGKWSKCRINNCWSQKLDGFIMLIQKWPDLCVPILLSWLGCTQMRLELTFKRNTRLSKCWISYWPKSGRTIGISANTSNWSKKIYAMIVIWLNASDRAGSSLFLVYFLQCGRLRNLEVDLYETEGDICRTRASWPTRDTAGLNLEWW